MDDLSADVALAKYGRKAGDWRQRIVPMVKDYVAEVARASEWQPRAERPDSRPDRPR